MNTTKNTRLIAGFVALVVIVGGLWYVIGRTEVIASDAVKEGDYSLDKKLALKDGASLTIKGNFQLQGKLSCNGGPVNVVVEGNATVNGTLECFRNDKEFKDAEHPAANGILLV